MGNPWTADYVTASGNLLADFTANANAEMQGRLQVARLYQMTDDAGVRDLLSFLLARDTMHQNQWIAAARELQEEGLEGLPVPSNFPQGKEDTSASYDYINFSDGEHAAEGSWASGPTPDGNGDFGYREAPAPGEGVPMPPPTRPDSRLYGTTDLPDVVEKAAGAVQDKLNRE
jgi:Mn-containing catalase